ncbi:MAG: recombinase family protein [Clostridia bacterium]
MPKNRIHPYGYKIEGGKTAIEPQEAEIIRRIYRRYADGISYKAIAQALTAEGIRYMPDKPIWNKNMVARILQNRSYSGENKYPAIIEASEQHSAELAQKPYTHTESQDIKTLKPLLVCGICGEPIRRRLKTSGGERWYCPADVNHIALAVTDKTLLQGIEALQLRLSAHPKPEKAKNRTGKQIDLHTIRLQNEIDLALSASEPNPAEIQQSILALAAQKYALIQDTDDGGKELEQILPQLTGTALHSELLKHITAQIKMSHAEVTALVLKNGQMIQPPTAEKGTTKHE